MPRWRCADCGNIIAGVEPGACSVCGHARFGANRSRRRKSSRSHSDVPGGIEDDPADRSTGPGGRSGHESEVGWRPNGRIVGWVLVVAGVAALLGWIEPAIPALDPIALQLGLLGTIVVGGAILVVTRGRQPR